MKRRINKDRVNELMQIHCHGNYNLFGRELGLDPAHLYRFIHNGIGGGKKMIFALMAYCDRKHLNFFNLFEQDECPR